MHQFDVSPGFRSHLAHCRREAARATIGNRMIQTSIPRLHNDIGDLLFSNRRTDLDRSARLGIDLAAHLARRDGRAVNTVAPCPSAEGNDEIAWLHLVWMAPVWQNTQTATKDQRIVNIAAVIKNGPVDSGNAHLIAIVAYATHHATGNTTRREHTIR